MRCFPVRWISGVNKGYNVQSRVHVYSQNMPLHRALLNRRLHLLEKSDEFS
jgi:hypothetical protein